MDFAFGLGLESVRLMAQYMVHSCNEWVGPELMARPRSAYVQCDVPVELESPSKRCGVL